MIRSLRQYHRRAVLAASIFIPITFIVGIAERKSVPTIPELPPQFAFSSPNFVKSEWERDNLFTNETIRVRLLREQNQTSRSAIELSPAGDFEKPDLLIYWVAANLQIAGKLPDDALLLGEFGTTALPLPEEACHSPGVIVLYSLANREIVDVSKPVSFIGSNPQ